MASFGCLLLISDAYLLMRCAHLWVQVLGKMLSWMWGSAQVGCMDSCSGIFPFWGMSLQNNWHIRFSIFEQFHVVYSPIPVPRGSVLPIACPYALFLISDFKYPLFLFLLLTFHLLCPTPLFLTACVLLNFHCLFKSRTMRNILQPFPVSSPSAAEVTKWLLAVHPASVTARKDGKFSTGELPWVHPESSYCISAREWRDLRGGCWVCCCGSLGWFTNKNIEK